VSCTTASISEHLHTHTNTAQDTEDFGWQLACARPAGETAFAVLYLTGELGAGKTTFARGFLHALGVTAPVRSPTYTLLELYPTDSVTLVHVDLYRVRAAAEIDSLGLREWARPGCVWLIEWPEKGSGRLPPADLTLAFTVGAVGHDIEARADSALGGEWLGGLTGAARGSGR
jgi:tRNA threonylcarbamoyladenosine biosynthesis protein TsaE